MTTYEHKTVGLNWFEANNFQANYSKHSNLGGSYGESDVTENQWHVVGTIPSTGDPHAKTFFLMERVLVP